MPWGGSLAASVTPAGQISGDLVSYITSYGILGVFAVIIGFAIYKGWRLESPAARSAERQEDRADLERENARLLAEKQEAEKQRDDALKMVAEQMFPLIMSFTAATQSLIPLLQDLVRIREDRRDPRR